MLRSVHCKKGVAVFPSPAGMSLTELSLAGNNLPNLVPGRFGQNKSRNLVNFVYSVVRLLSLPSGELVLLYDGEAEGVELLEGEVQLVQLRTH